MESICIRIKELRKQLCMSQVEFAKNLGVTNAHISKIEKGGTVPSDALIKLISKEYGVNENWLQTGEKPIFIYELMDRAEEQLITSTDRFNKLLSSDSYIIRGLASDLKFAFSNITDVHYLNDAQKAEYLTIVKKMFSLIDQYNLVVKEHIYSKQTIFDNVLNELFDNYKIELNKCINDYVELLKK
jgi:transcriptional regulator with XRE-family HTH domain